MGGKRRSGCRPAKPPEFSSHQTACLLDVDDSQTQHEECYDGRRIHPCTGSHDGRPVAKGERVFLPTVRKAPKETRLGLSGSPGPGTPYPQNSIVSTRRPDIGARWRIEACAGASPAPRRQNRSVLTESNLRLRKAGKVRPDGARSPIRGCFPAENAGCRVLD